MTLCFSGRIKGISICIGFSQISSWKALFDYLILIGLKPLKKEDSTIRRLKPTAIETRLKPFRESVRGSVKMKSALTVFRSLKTSLVYCNIIYNSMLYASIEYLWIIFQILKHPPKKVTEGDKVNP